MAQVVPPLADRCCSGTRFDDRGDERSARGGNMSIAGADMAKIEMAEIDMQLTRLLGFAPQAGLDALVAAMRAVPGPKLQVHRAPCTGAGDAVAALVQPEPDVPFFGRGREALTASLRSVQRRLEVACQAGAFLPMDPAAACCPTPGVPGVLSTAWDGLAVALAQHGLCQQWDISLRWTAEDAVARHRGDIAPAAAQGRQALADAVGAALRNERGHREAALLAALAPAVLAFASGGPACAETEVAVTVLVASGGDAAVEAALDGMAAEHVEGASIDLRGPLPPLSFFAVRLATVDAQAVSDAWATLGLADRVDLSTLHQQWRRRAAAAHPDRLPVPADASADGVADLTDAYRLLRDLLPSEAKVGGLTLEGLLACAGPRLIMPGLIMPADTPLRDQAPERQSNPMPADPLPALLS